MKIFYAFFSENYVSAEEAIDQILEENPSKPIQKCKPHTSWQEDCNTCTCNNEGTFNMCTTKVCEEVDPTTTEKPVQKCKPNETFMEGCNSCVCNSEGTLAMCSASTCIQDDKDPMEQIKPEVFRCKSLEVFKMDCNTCVCNKEGTNAACTEIGCTHYRNEAIGVPSDNKASPPVSTHCVPLETSKKDCNTCVCNSEGTAIECTKVQCLQEIPQDEPIKPIEENKKEEVSVPVKSDFTCKALESYKMGCNTCVCNELGTNAACTQIDCQDTPVADVPKVIIDIEDEKAINLPSIESDPTVTNPEANMQGILCKPGTHFMNDCNNCTCNDEGNEAVCTLLDCSAKV